MMLTYNETMQHHENEEMCVEYIHSDEHEALITITVPMAGNKKQTVTLSHNELRGIHSFSDGFITAINILKDVK